MPKAHGGAALHHPCVLAPDDVATGHQELRLALTGGRGEHLVGGIHTLFQFINNCLEIHKNH
jgi:hypothetical protein